MDGFAGISNYHCHTLPDRVEGQLCKFTEGILFISDSHHNLTVNQLATILKPGTEICNMKN